MQWHGRPRNDAAGLCSRCAMFDETPGRASAQAFFMRVMCHDLALQRFAFP
nr:hypothetical protein BN444_03600 [Xanthomonas translucens pv. translucens DSM 18974]